MVKLHHPDFRRIQELGPPEGPSNLPQGNEGSREGVGKKGSYEYLYRGHKTPLMLDFYMTYGQYFVPPRGCT